MNSILDWHDVAAAVSAAPGHRLARVPGGAISGGSVSTCLRWTSDAGAMFIKVTAASRAWALEAEADGLRALAPASAIRLPRVLGAGVASNRAWLALEWIDLASPGPGSEARLGELLAEQHRVTSATFGWHRTNTIGLTEQKNEPDADWARFYAARRLAFQLDILEAGGHAGRLIERGRRLCESVPALLGGHSPVASLLQHCRVPSRLRCRAESSPCHDSVPVLVAILPGPGPRLRFRLRLGAHFIIIILSVFSNPGAVIR